MQTPDERVALLQQGTDGCIFCLDLSHQEGQEVADALAKQIEDIAAVVRNRENNHQYLLALLPVLEEGRTPKPVLVTLVTTSGLPQAIAEVWTRAKQQLGDAIAVVVVPASPRVKEIFRTLEQSAGTA